MCVTPNGLTVSLPRKSLLSWGMHSQWDVSFTFTCRSAGNRENCVNDGFVTLRATYLHGFSCNVLFCTTTKIILLTQESDSFAILVENVFFWWIRSRTLGECFFGRTGRWQTWWNLVQRFMFVALLFPPWSGQRKTVFPGWTSNIEKIWSFWLHLFSSFPSGEANVSSSQFKVWGMTGVCLKTVNTLPSEFLVIIKSQGTLEAGLKRLLHFLFRRPEDKQWSFSEVAFVCLIHLRNCVYSYIPQVDQNRNEKRKTSSRQ